MAIIFRLHAPHVKVRFTGRLPLGEHERILELLREAKALAEALGDQRRVGWLSAYTGIHLSFLGEHEEAVASDERALAIADALNDASLHIATNFTSEPAILFSAIIERLSTFTTAA